MTYSQRISFQSEIITALTRSCQVNKLHVIQTSHLKTFLNDQIRILLILAPRRCLFPARPQDHLHLTHPPPPPKTTLLSVPEVYLPCPLSYQTTILSLCPIKRPSISFHCILKLMGNKANKYSIFSCIQNLVNSP